MLGTAGALGLYRQRLSSLGLEVISLDDHEQIEFMAVLYRIKSGDLGSGSRETMAGLAHRLVALGAEVVIAGCTEVPLVLDQEALTVPFIDATDALARRCVAVCLEP